MDAFSTAAIACEAIYKTLEAASAFPSDSRSLAARFKYDARILRHFCNYFEQHMSTEAGLSAEDQALLEESASYLGTLLSRVELCRAKLTSPSRWSKQANRLTWVLRRSEMKDLEAELYEWTRRLDLRLVALPERARTVMSVGAEDEIKSFTPRLAARTRIERFTTTAAIAKKAIWERLLVNEDQVEKSPVSESSAPHTNARDFSLGTFEGGTVLLEFRRVPMQTARDGDLLEAAQSDIGEFAAALNRLDSTVSGLLNCCGFFYSPAPQPTFGLIYRLSHDRQRGDVVTNFKDLLRARDAKGRRQRLRYSLNQRLEFAKRLTTAVLFVHAIGWVHKAIMPHNILLLGRESASSSGNDGDKKDKGRRLTWSVSSPYLVGFEVARSDDADTVPGARGAPLPLEVALYMHPSLQDTTSHVRCTMAHDIYSLGVVLLELGIWSPLEERPELQGACRDPPLVSETLFKLASETEVLMGKRYRDIVQACLSQGAEGSGSSLKQVSEVLEKLEDLVQSV
jgi:hypothetical protein